MAFENENLAFEKIGLNQYEADTYKTLLRLGPSTASDISRNANVPYGRIYDILYSLENKNLVRIIPEKTKKFAATDPEQLEDRVQNTISELRELANEVHEMKQLYERGEYEPVTMVKGRRNFYKILRSLPQSNAFSYAIKYNVTYYPDWVRELHEELRRGIIHHTLARYDSETEEHVHKWMEAGDSIRQFSNAGVAMGIHDTHVMIGLIQSNVTLVIRDQAFIDVMKRMFEATYAQADEIPPNRE